MRQNAWNTPFGRLLIVASAISAIGGCVFASSMVGFSGNQAASGEPITDENGLARADIDTNATDVSGMRAPDQEPPDSGADSSPQTDQSPGYYQSDENAEYMNADVNEE